MSSCVQAARADKGRAAGHSSHHPEKPAIAHLGKEGRHQQRCCDPPHQTRRDDGRGDAWIITHLARRGDVRAWKKHPRKDAHDDEKGSRIKQGSPRCRKRGAAHSQHMQTERGQKMGHKGQNKARSQKR
jgi:hypothetical protein